MRSGSTLMDMCTVSMMKPRISTTCAGKKVLAFDTGTPRSEHTLSHSCICSRAASYVSHPPKKSSTYALRTPSRDAPRRTAT